MYCSALICYAHERKAHCLVAGMQLWPHQQQQSLAQALHVLCRQQQVKVMLDGTLLNKTILLSTCFVHHVEVIKMKTKNGPLFYRTTTGKQHKSFPFQSSLGTKSALILFLN